MVDIHEVFPELAKIQDEEIRRRTATAIEHAIRESPWADIRDVPYIDSWSDEPLPQDLVEHTWAVTNIAIEIAKELDRWGIEIERDELIAGSLLHDIGILFEFAPGDGSPVRRWEQRLIRHPMFGLWIALEHDLPINVAHIIGSHSKEGQFVDRTPEAIVQYHADWLIYDIEQAE